MALIALLDSDHSQAHVSRDLDLLSKYVSVGSYLVVEDTNINGHPTFRRFGPGPYEPVRGFLCRSDEFEVDRTREKFLMTFNPMGFLKRVR
jgi:cephalosporin hydroxylase